MPRTWILLITMALVILLGGALAEKRGKMIEHPQQHPQQPVSPPSVGGGHERGNPGSGGGPGHDGDTGNGHEKKHPGEQHDENDNHSEEMHYDADYSFFGAIRWSDGSVIAGSRKLVGDNPWLELLAPGMKIEVKGEVEDSVMKVSRIEIRYPRSWSFYEGPAVLLGLKGGWVKVWFSEGDGVNIFKQIATEDSDRIKIAACYRAGSWKAIPSELGLELKPSSWGWWLVEGVETTNGIHWHLSKKLPGDCR